MKRLVFIVLYFISTVFFVSGQKPYDSAEVKLFRESRDKNFRNPQISPLRREDQSSFDGLKYFAVNEFFCVKAKFTPVSGDRVFMMPTSSGRAAKYLKIGVLNFVLDGKEFSLNAYRRDYENPNFKPINDDLFVPFKDLTNSKETYGAGRYVYLRMPIGSETVLDFNLAYNPSCAYGDESFSCTLPPKENFLNIEIKAGEKIYK